MSAELAAVAESTLASSPRFKACLAGSLLVFAMGLASLLYALGSSSAALDIQLFTVSYLFLLGVSQTGVVFCALTRLVHAQWAKPYYRLAELSTLAFLPFAFLGFLFIVIYGRDDLFYWLAAAEDEHLSPWLNMGGLLTRDLLGLLWFYGLSVRYVVTAVAPDLAGAAADKRVDHTAVEAKLYRLSPWVVISFVVCNTFLAWDFGMMLIPHWHSTVFPIFFWFGNLFAGTAALIAIPAFAGRIGGEGELFGRPQIRGLSMLLTCFTLMWLYFFWAQFFVIWFGNLPRETDPLWRQMYGHYAPYYWTMMVGCFFLPLAMLVFAIFNRSVLAMCAIGAGINLGVWLSRYLMIVPVFSAEHRPFGNWLDVTLALGLLAGFVAVTLLLASRWPLYAYWEMRLDPKTGSTTSHGVRAG